MSDPRRRNPSGLHPEQREVDRTRDTGSTLPELLMTVMLLGLIVSSLTAAVIVMVRQQDNSEGRLNVARAETNIGLWLPADLASAEDVNLSPGASPCGTTCPPNAVTGGSNTVMLTWDSLEAGLTDAVTSTINVSYRYVQVRTDWQLVRVECSRVEAGPWTCKNNIVLRGLMAPPPGSGWRAGRTSPTWVVNVSEPPEPGVVPNGTGTTTTTAAPDPAAPVKVAKRVIVTINGGGDLAGAGGGFNTISLSAGGATRTMIDATSTAGTPTFNQARTRCGGNYGLIIDDSGSIGGAMPTVIAGVRAFIDAFAGTPVKLQIVRFDGNATTFGPGRGRYYDMLVEADVTELRNLVGTLSAGGSTNWEDALHRMFYDANGNVQSVLPETVLFFTDGEPTVSRINSTTSPGAPRTRPPRQVELANGTTAYRQEAFNRAKFIADQFRSSVNLIGVGVGPAFNNSSPWLDYGPGWHWDHFRGFHYEARTSATAPWTVVDKATYDQTTPNGNRRIAYTAPYSFWEPTTLAIYNTLPSAARQRTKDYSPPFNSFDVVTTWTPNSTILTRLIAGNDFGQPALSVNGAYVNAEVANMYLLPEWSQFTGALQAVALAECGGTVTVQTRVGTAAAADPFEYQHTKSTSPTGVPQTATLDVIKTTRTYPSGTFDFSIPTGGWLTVEIEPMIPANSLYRPEGWSCKTGPNVKAIETFPVNGGPWTGIRLQVRANEAISCVMQVTR